MTAITPHKAGLGPAMRYGSPPRRNASGGNGPLPKLAPGQGGAGGQGAEFSEGVLAGLLTLGLIALAAGILLVGIAAAFEILGDLLLVVGVMALAQYLHGGPNGTQATIVDLNLPIPGSDVLPTLSGREFQVANGVMLIAATAGTQPDNGNKAYLCPFSDTASRLSGGGG